MDLKLARPGESRESATHQHSCQTSLLFNVVVVSCAAGWKGSAGSILEWRRRAIDPGRCRPWLVRPRRLFPVRIGRDPKNHDEGPAAKALHRRNVSPPARLRPPMSVAETRLFLIPGAGRIAPRGLLLRLAKGATRG